jgi:hypothetical protein
MIWNLVRSIYRRSSIEIAHFVLIHLQTWLPQAILVLDWSISKNLLLWNCFAKMNRFLVGSTYGRFCVKFPQSRMKGERHRLRLNKKICVFTGLPLLWNQREKWLLFQVLTKEKWETTERSGESTGRSQNISLIVPLFTFAGHYRGIRML